MIAKILKNSAGFPGVRYNTDKIDRNSGVLLKVSGFGSLQGLHNLRPQDYLNYLQMVSSVNKRIEKPQFHAVISARQRTYDDQALTVVATAWLKEMGYGDQPYLIVFHKDTENNHVHLVSTRVGRDGKKINSGYERLRSLSALHKVLGYDAALQYRFTTKAQFYMVLESMGYPGRDLNEQKLMKHMAENPPDPKRTGELKALFLTHKGKEDFATFMADRYQVELVFHAAPGKAPYGYTIIDHGTKQVFKGSEVLSMKHLTVESTADKNPNMAEPTDELHFDSSPNYIGPIWIADDIDDEATLGRNRQRKKKARTNTR